MYIEPNTTLRMLKNVPLDKKHTDTYWFTSAEEQVEAFKLYTKHTFNNMTYQRVNKGECIIKRKADDLYDCNYMMFQNTNYGDKWFYAFVDKVEFVSNVACKVFYTIDTIQTWLLEIDFAECFVEREHSDTDVIGENLVPEKLELGEYICESFDGTEFMGDYKIVVAATFDKDGDDVSGALYSRIYSGLRYNVFDTYTEVNEFLEENRTKADGIVSIFMIPADFVTSVNGEVSPKIVTISKNTTKFVDNSSQNGRKEYEPRNKKLFTYPYNFLYVTNLEGNSAVFPYEFFGTASCNFMLSGDFSCNPTVVLAPTSYKGVGGTNYDEKMCVSGFPQCSFNTDAFKAWLAQSAVSLPTSLAGVATSALFASTVPVVGTAAAVVTGVTGVLGAVGQIYEHAIMPNQARGNPANGAQVALGIKDFAFIKKHITNEYAEIIDKFFDMYGYATNRVKKPNLFDSKRGQRPCYNYIKTRDCLIYGGIPADDKQQICDIFDNGIRFWTWNSLITNYKKPNIGDYTLCDNEV